MDFKNYWVVAGIFVVLVLLRIAQRRWVESPHLYDDFEAISTRAEVQRIQAEAGLPAESIPAPSKQREGDQRLPEVNDLPFVADLLQDYIEKRKQIGIQRYGTPLQAHNGRDALLDAFEEAVDLATYLAQVIIERDGELPA